MRRPARAVSSLRLSLAGLPMSIEELEAAVTRLSAPERSRFLAWIDETRTADSQAARELVPHRADTLADAFGAWTGNTVDFEALRAEADAR